MITSTNETGLPAMTITAQVFSSINGIDPIKVIPFNSLNEAKDYADNNPTTPIEVLEGYMFRYRNFPNMAMGTIDSRAKAKELWLAGDSSWVMHDFPS